MNISRALLTGCLLIVMFGIAYQIPSAANQEEKIVWQDIALSQLQVSRDANRPLPSAFRSVQTDFLTLQSQLGGLTRNADQALTLELPLPNGVTERFTIQSDSILEPALSEKYPNIQTFTLKGVDNLAATGRVDVTPLGFHAYIQTPAGDIFIDPYSGSDLSIYISYAKSDSQRIPRPVVERAPTGRFAERMVRLRANRGPLDANIDLGAVKRTYQMVAVATGE
ncbi:MAG: hypothetical protein AAGD96_29700, partial [Chloroflexota bacterium]